MKVINAILTLLTTDIKINFGTKYTPVEIHRDESLTNNELCSLLVQLDNNCGDRVLPQWRDLVY